MSTGVGTPPCADGGASGARAEGPAGAAVGLGTSEVVMPRTVVCGVRGLY